MFAVIRTGGKQYRVQEGDVLCVEKLDKERGKKVTFEQVLLVEDGKKTLIGTPFVENARVKAEVIENFQNEKIIVFKKKRRKQHRRTRGHRQELARVRIEEIALGLKAAAEEKPPVKEVKAAPRRRKAAAEAKPKEVKKVKKEVKKAPKAKAAPVKAKKPKSASKKTTTKTAKKADKQ